MTFGVRRDASGACCGSAVAALLPRVTDAARKATPLRRLLFQGMDSRLLAGVVAGLGGRIGIDPWPVRLLVVLLACVLHVGLILPYVILWILMPVDEKAPATVWPPEPPVSPTR